MHLVTNHFNLLTARDTWHLLLFHSHYSVIFIFIGHPLSPCLSLAQPWSPFLSSGCCKSFIACLFSYVHTMQFCPPTHPLYFFHFTPFTAQFLYLCVCGCECLFLVVLWSIGFGSYHLGSQPSVLLVHTANSLVYIYILYIHNFTFVHINIHHLINLLYLVFSQSYVFVFLAGG